MVIKFCMGGRLRFLSHGESLRLFQRALSRSGAPVRHSSGFNPRARLSLPLPRSVGIETEGDLLCVRITGGDFDSSQFSRRLCAQLPDGCEVLSVEALPAGAGFEACYASYILPTGPDVAIRQLEEKIDRLLASESLQIDRVVDARGTVRRVDVRRFLDSIRIEGAEIVVGCRMGPGGSVRVEEILRLLELDADDLAGPVRRTNVQWRQYNKN